MSLIGALTKAAKAGETAKKTAPFYSAVDEALSNLKRPKGTGAEFLTEVMKTKGVKPAEIADRKLEQAFKDKGKMTKQEAENILARNPPPKVSERILEDLDDDARQKIIDDKMEIYGYDRYDEVPRSRMRQWENEIDYEAAQYGDYKLAGGKNYREILLKLPQEAPEIQKADKKLKLAETVYQQDPSQKNYAQMQIAQQELEVAKITSPAYRSSHWKDDPNTLAHMRVQDRIGPNGEKILQVEEIQSDWHQAGRKKGYKTKENLEKWYNQNKLDSDPAFADLNAEQINTLERNRMAGMGGDESVPDAPFKKNWHELAMKRLLNYAADKGYDSIAITPGAEHYRRYGSERIDWKKGDDGWTVGAKEQFGGMHEGQNIEDLARERGILLERNGDPVKSKEDLHRIINVVMRRDNTPEQIDKLTNRVWERMQVEPEGTSLPRKEGMEGFYDKMLTDYLNSFGNPYGAKVEKHSIPVSTRDPLSTGWDGGQGDHPFITVQDLNEPFDGMVELMRRHPETGEEILVGRMTRPESERRIAEELQKLDTYNQIKLHNFPITPEMRQQIQQKGLPLYQQIGIPTAGASAASQMPEEPEYGAGGIVNSAAKIEALAKLKQMSQEMRPRAEAVQNLMKMDENRYLRDVVPNSLTNPEIEADIARMKARAEASQPEVKKADGGAIDFNTAPDMSDGGRIIQGAPFKHGGKVKVTTNRDAMFMELSNKKLKRK